ncbi:anthocyanidin 3-O-glucosyltransferase 5-like [Humulus lupulus]|uniref:anthocyanidin 3-O-glucosyltransferase 5-like n=1 Tax=Humulus lupulus TaxID=3486 RepID=UPI002B40DDC3|nr:anthocyanidin 3-O-glucosyltransferase 5-like [Humulus lupulus]
MRLHQEKHHNHNPFAALIELYNTLLHCLNTQNKTLKKKTKTMVLVAAPLHRPHVAVLSSPGMGHIIPLLELAKRLAADHGCHVSFLNITAEASAAQTKLLSSPDFPPNLHVIDLPDVDVSTLVSSDSLIVTRLSVIVQESLRCLKSVLLDLGKPDVVVIDLFCTQAFEVCEELSIPVYSFYTAPAALFSLSLYLLTLDKEVDCEFVDLPEPIRVPGCSPIRTEDLLDQVRNRKSEECKWYLLHTSRLPLAAGVLMNTWEDLEPSTLKAIREDPYYNKISTPPIHPVGPLIRETEPITESGVECLAWLDNQPSDSVVFVALGSGGTLSAAQLTEIAWGLELSGQRFVWVVRTPTEFDASATFFNVGGDINDPKSFLPVGFLERTKKVGYVVASWAPQVAVLRHRSTGAFLSHCGWNSTMESMRHGVPMIAWPLYAEQKMNATALVEDVGVAVRPAEDPGKGIVTREEIKRVVSLVIGGEEGKLLRLRAGKLKESAEKVLSDNGGSSYDSLTRITNDWMVSRISSQNFK